MSYLRAFLRGVRRGLGLPVQPIDYGPEAQLTRLASKMEGRNPDAY